MKQITLDDIVKSSQVKEVQFEVPEWGGYLILREMTAEARDAYEGSLLRENEKGEIERNLSNARAKMIAACAIGPDGKRMFDNESKVNALGNQPNTIISRIFDKCRELNGMNVEDVEELAGN